MIDTRRLALDDDSIADQEVDTQVRCEPPSLVDDWHGLLALDLQPSELELRLIAQAQIVLGDLPGAIRSIERAIALQGPMKVVLREDLEKLQRTQRIRESVAKERAGR